MKKVTAEICSNTDEVTIKVEHRDDGSHAGFLHVICENIIERNKIQNKIEDKDNENNKFKNLTPIENSSMGPSELYYYDSDNVYDKLSVDSDNQYDFSGLDESKPFDVELLNLVETFLYE